MKNAASALMTVVILLSAVSSASAGPDWDEVGDAGSTPGTAQIIGGGGPVKTIRGNLTGAPLAGGPDFEDMYQIIIDEPTIFCARTVPLNATLDCCNQPINPLLGTNFNTQLWIFKADGRGLLGNDDQPGNAPFSALTNTANDGSGAMIVTPGIYYIAVSGGPARDPVSSTGQIFNQATLTEISGPDGPGGANPIINWIGTGVSGHYEIVMCGVKSVPGIPAMSPAGTALLMIVIIGAGALVIARKNQRRMAV